MKYLTTLALALFASITTINAQDWEQVASLPDNYQTDHSFAFALNGYGYILTGYNSFGFPTNDMYRYDASTDEWTQIDDFPGGSRGYAIGEVYDGKAYFGFGTDGVEYFDDFWVFDQRMSHGQSLSNVLVLEEFTPQWWVPMEQFLLD